MNLNKKIAILLYVIDMLQGWEVLPYISHNYSGYNQYTCASAGQKVLIFICYHLITEILAVVKYYSNFAPSKNIVNIRIVIKF